MEARRYEFEARLGGKPIPDEMDFLVNDMTLDLLVRHGRSIFQLDLGFYSGVLNVSVVHGGRTLASLDALSDPDFAKLTRDEYADLVSDVARSTLALYRLSGLSISAETNPSSIRSDLVTLNLIRSQFDSFERAVRRVAEQPLRRLESASRSVDIMRARKVDDRWLTHALRTGTSRVATSGEFNAAPRLVEALRGRWIDHVTEHHRVERIDVYENRAIVGFMKWLGSTIEAMRSRISRNGNMPQNLVTVWTGRIESWRRRLAALNRRDPFGELEPDPTLRATSVFRLHPDYASAFTAMIRMKAGLGAGTATIPSLSLDRTFQLYEMWCYIGLLEAVGELFPQTRAQIASILHGIQAPNELGIVLLSGNVSTINLTDQHTLTYQRRFSPKSDRSGFQTHLIDAIPDVTIAREGPLAVNQGIVIFDPKYRGGSSLLDGIRDLHVYRDAIRGNDGRALVRAAAALAPRPFEYDYDKLWNGSQTPGVVAARPGHDPEVFKRLIRDALKALT